MLEFFVEPFPYYITPILHISPSADSFEHLVQWLEQCRAAVTAQDKQPLYALVANKIDLEHLR